MEELYGKYLACGMQVSTDTRDIRPGMMFFALKGPSFNGNLFAGKALELGAQYAVTDEPTIEDERIIRVDNVLETLQELATFHREIINPRMLGIGGSNGKTTTKELIVSVLSTSYKVLATKGNLNNHIGVPLTLLQLRREHQIAVIEMGANREGDIRELCEIARPELGLITNIGKEHLEGFGDLEGVARAESELFDYLLRNEGHAFVNLDDQWLKAMGEKMPVKTMYGKDVSPVSDVQTEPRISFTYGGGKVVSALMGEHNMQNIMAAIAVAEFFHTEPEKIRQGISSYVPENNRSQWILTEKGNHVFLDAYNANPSSMEMALKAFEKVSGRKIAVLGDMFELGEWEAEEHRRICDMAAHMAFNEVILVGKAFSSIASDAAHVHRFADREKASAYLKDQHYTGVHVLIKGSRGMRMEELLERF